jgi:predicted transposase YbfD/YdcC
VISNLDAIIEVAEILSFNFLVVVKLRPQTTISEHFSAIEDPRLDRTKKHQLIDIITITLCAVISGAESWSDIELFGNCKYDWFKSFLELPNGIPSHDTFGRVFARINPEQLEKCFSSWVKSINNLLSGEQIAIDGKTLRHSYDHNNGIDAIVMISQVIDSEQKWSNLNAVVRVEYLRQFKNGKSQLESRYFITSLSKNAEQLADYIRGHWTIENQLHWVLDVEFGEDDSRIKFDNAPENLAVIRHLALNLLKLNQKFKGSIKSKRNRAGWDNNYLRQILLN